MRGSSQVVAGRIQTPGIAIRLIVIHFSHIHVSLRDSTGKNIFGVSEGELKSGGRKNAKSADLKYVSEECEWFLAGILDGIADGKHITPIFFNILTFLDPLH